MKIAEDEARLERERVRQENGGGHIQGKAETGAEEDADPGSPHGNGGNNGHAAASLEAAINDGLKYPEWQKPLLDALLQLDTEELKIRVAVAETAIHNRMQTISRDVEHCAERQAIEDALATLRILKRGASGVSE